MLIYAIIVLAILARFIPHMPNVAPVTALAIFSAVYLPKKQAIAIPLIARFVSDIFLGFFSWPLMLAVYASHLVGVLFGLWVKKTSGVIPAPEPESIYGSRNKFGMTQWSKVIASSLGSSIIFFLVTNFAFFYTEYSHSIAGVIAAYTNGLPFFRGTIIGDLGYTAALFGAYQLVLYAKHHRERASQALA